MKIYEYVYKVQAIFASLIFCPCPFLGMEIVSRQVLENVGKETHTPGTVF